MLHRLKFQPFKFHQGIALEDEDGEKSTSRSKWLVESIETQPKLREDILFSEEFVLRLRGGANYKNQAYLVRYNRPVVLDKHRSFNL